MLSVENALPTIGLSGVVMAVMTALAVMLPKTKIRCFLWIFFFMRTFKIPVLIIAVWYIGWDLYEVNTFGHNTYINYTAHLSGAVIGACLAIYYLQFKKTTLSLAGEWV